MFFGLFVPEGSCVDRAIFVEEILALGNGKLEGFDLNRKTFTVYIQGASVVCVAFFEVVDEFLRCLSVTLAKNLYVVLGQFVGVVLFISPHSSEPNHHLI